MDKSIVFVTGSLSQPRIIRRILSFYNDGYSVKVYGYERGVYTVNHFPQGIEVNVLGNMTDGVQYFKRLCQMWRDMKSVLKKEGKEVIYYSFGFSQAVFLKRKKVTYLYEISDIFYGYKRFNLIRPLLKLIDASLVKKSKCTVVTSQGFVDYLFKTPPKNIVLLPNKLNSCFADVSRVSSIRENRTSLVFSFIGAIRYPNTVLRFARVIGQCYPNHSFHFYGDSTMVKRFQEELSPYKNVVFFGPYRNPQDLEEIYSKVDVVVACYETESLNECIAEPNKLYEALFFNKPIIVSTNSFVGKRVKELNCGLVIDAYSEEAIKKAIDSLTPERIKEFSDNNACIDTKSLIDSPEPLFNKLSEKIS